MILLDFNAVIISSIAVNAKYLGNSTDINDIRHLFFNSVGPYLKKYKAEYGDLVMCCDSRDVWRKDYFPYYKANRTREVKPDGLDWEFVLESIETIRSEIEQYFPYHVVKVDRTEADDIIGVLVEWHQTNNLVKKGLSSEPEKFMILSADHDFIQLQKYKNVKQWSTIQKKYVSHGKPKEYLIEHIMKGDKGDGVPNIMSMDDVFVMGKRQGTMFTKKISAVIDSTPEDELNQEQLRNYYRNKKMVDLSQIPQEFKDSIIETFISYEPPKANIMTYFIKNRLTNLLSNIQDY